MSLIFRTDSFEDAKYVRQCVFIDEQGFQVEFEDIDDDEEVGHITAYDNGTLVGCARVCPSRLQAGFDADPKVWIIGRIAILPAFRKKGYGSAILAEVERYLQAQGATSAHLHAQMHAKPFYERAGYSAYGPIELDEHVEHQWMSKTL